MSITAQPLQHRAWVITGLLAAALAVVLALTVFSNEGQTARPELQRVLDGAVAGSGRLAPGATAYVSGPHGTWVGSAGLANVRTGEPMRPEARMALRADHGRRPRSRPEARVAPDSRHRLPC